MTDIPPRPLTLEQARQALGEIFDGKITPLMFNTVLFLLQTYYLANSGKKFIDTEFVRSAAGPLIKDFNGAIRRWGENYLDLTPAPTSTIAPPPAALVAIARVVKNYYVHDLRAGFAREPNFYSAGYTKESLTTAELSAYYHKYYPQGSLKAYCDKLIDEWKAVRPPELLNRRQAAEHAWQSVIAHIARPQRYLQILGGGVTLFGVLALATQPLIGGVCVSMGLLVGNISWIEVNLLKFINYARAWCTRPAPAPKN